MQTLELTFRGVPRPMLDAPVSSCLHSVVLEIGRPIASHFCVSMMLLRSTSPVLCGDAQEPAGEGKG